MLTRGAFKTKEKYLASGDGADKKARSKHPERDIKQRRIMAYAVPVALATWIVLFTLVPKWPHRLLPAAEARPLVKTGAASDALN
jgi:prepilin peptidase CpaA